MFKLPLIVAFLTVACFSAVAQNVDTIDPALKARIDAIAAGVMEQRGVPSASIAVVQGGKLAAFGPKTEILTQHTKAVPTPVSDKPVSHPEA